MVAGIQHVANYQYELPENFEDEEIDEDEAFNEKDEEVYGHIFGGTTVADQDEDEDNKADVELTRDDFSDDVSGIFRCLTQSIISLCATYYELGVDSRCFPNIDPFET